MSPFSQVVTANRLRDGSVVFLTAGHRWSERIGVSAVAGDEAAAEALLAAAERAVRAGEIVAGPYLIDVEIAAGQLRPLRYREYLRAVGPSDHPEFGRSTEVLTVGQE